MCLQDPAQHVLFQAWLQPQLKQDVLAKLCFQHMDACHSYVSLQADSN